MNKLNGWVFTYNSLNKKWMATKREHYVDLFSRINNSTVIKSSSIDTLIELIIKTDGNQTRLKKLTNEKV